MIRFDFHPTPNPAKAALFLEDAQLPYEVIPVDTSKGKRVLCVEDNPDIGKLLVEILDDAGYIPEWVSDGHQALQRWPQAALILLDLMLPGIDGLSLCRHIRKQDAAVPLIMLSAKASAQDIVRGFEIGADDYVTKPFDSRILLARVQSLLRRCSSASPGPVAAAEQPPIVCGDLAIDSNQHRVTLAGRALALTAKEFALLALFARQPGRAFSRAELLDLVWGPEFDGFDHTVNTHINRLRGKLSANSAQPRYIHTVWGVGYRFADASVPEPRHEPNAWQHRPFFSQPVRAHPRPRRCPTVASRNASTT